MIIKETVHNFKIVGKLNIEEIYEDCIKDFSDKTLSMLKERILFRDSDFLKAGPRNQETFHKLDVVGIDNYNEFNNLGRRITFNTKGVEYQELYTSPVKESVLSYLKNYDEDLCCSLKKENSSLNLAKFLSEDYSEKLVCDENLVPMPKLFECFGIGEFPYMEITIVRIGNVLYYFYQITR